MNPKTSRWSCRIVRAWVSMAGDGGHGRGAGSRHIARCSDCQRFFAAADDFEGALRRSAPAQRRAPGPGMDQRIMRAVRESAPQPARHRGHSRLIPLFVGAAAAVALTFAFLQIRHGSASIGPKEQVVTTGEAPSGSGRTDENHAGIADSILAVTQPVSSALQKDPLQTEVNNVYADARSAVRFLALNFLPSGAVAQNGDNRSTLNSRGAAGG